MRRAMPSRTQPLRRDTGTATLSVPVLRPKTCSKARGGCGELFTPTRPMQIACSPTCAVRVGQMVRLKQDKAGDKATRERLMTLSDWRKRAQAGFNGFIKCRDAGLPCISCDAPPSDTDQAGHYLSRGAHPELALDEANTHRQCLRCNLHRHGNQVRYRIGLIARIGQAEVDRLEGPNPLRHDTADSLKVLAAEYRAKKRALAKETA